MAGLLTLNDKNLYWSKRHSAQKPVMRQFCFPDTAAQRKILLKRRSKQAGGGV
jgi:hypothetical protein